MSLTEKIGDLVTVLIRSSGERTGQACRLLVLEQGIPDKNIANIKESPFSKALRKSYETGIDQGRKWTLCLDADVLLLPDSIQRLVDQAERQAGNVVEVRGLMLDKFLGGLRQGGIHLYRTSLLPHALEFLPKEETIRPEQHTLNSMREAGFPWKGTDVIIGIHDFEQYYFDIYRKCFIHARKFQEYAEIFLSFWPERAEEDVDFAVALKGLSAGMEYRGKASIDVRQEIFRDGFGKIGLQEKTDIPAADLKLRYVERVFQSWKIPDVYHKYFPYELVSPRRGNIKPQVRKNNLHLMSQKLGMARYVIYLLGWAVNKIGGRLMRAVDHRGKNS